MAEEEEEEEEDTRTIGDILWPDPWYTEEENRRYWAEVRASSWHFICHFHPRTFFPLLGKVLKEYIETWDGFFTQPGLIVYSKEELEERAKEKDEEEQLKKASFEFEATLKQAERNARRNIRGAKTLAMMAHKEFTEKTGLRTTDDMRELSRYFLERFTEVVQEFMAGYRKGRDEEVQKMLTTYFQDPPETEEPTEPKRRRRKIKRRRLRDPLMAS